jgi:hypothetical protein
MARAIKRRRKQSDTVDNLLGALFARLAQACAQRAMYAVTPGSLRPGDLDMGNGGNNDLAKQWAAHCEEWLERAGANAARDYFRVPDAR